MSVSFWLKLTHTNSKAIPPFPTITILFALDNRFWNAWNINTRGLISINMEHFFKPLMTKVMFSVTCSVCFVCRTKVFQWHLMGKEQVNIFWCVDTGTFRHHKVRPFWTFRNLFKWIQDIIVAACMEKGSDTLLIYSVCVAGNHKLTGERIQENSNKSNCSPTGQNGAWYIKNYI